MQSQKRTTLPITSFVLFAHLIVPGAMLMVGQKARPTNAAGSSKPGANNTEAKSYLKDAVAKSKQQKMVSIVVLTKVQGREIISRFEYAEPDRYYMHETDNARVNKEAIEIAGQRYQKKDNQWVKVRKDPFPLREQFDSYFPIKLASTRSDLIKLKNSSVALVKNSDAERLESKMFRYTVTYIDFAPADSGLVWVNSTTGLLESLETTGHGLFGPAVLTWKYDYSKKVVIEAPKVHIERDWID